MHLSAVVSAKDTLQKGNSEQRIQTNIQNCLLYIVVQGAC